jgi:hypothetical protein
MNTPDTPAATAARASTGMCLRSPPRPCPARRAAARNGGVEHHRAAGVAHHREAAHVDDQIVVAEAEAALADQDLLVPGAGSLLTTFFISQGERNWPFLMLSGLPCCAALRMKFVWRQRKAGVWITSTTAATSASGVSSWTSVRTGYPICFFHLWRGS